MEYGKGKNPLFKKKNKLEWDNSRYKALEAEAQQG